MASTGTSPALPATLPFTPGQGSYPVLSLQYSTDDVSDTDPLWQDASTLVRSFTTSRGRKSELDEMEAGTASLVLDNRDRTFDPTVSPAVRPMNRWRIRAPFSGATESIFVGYAESYDQQWPGGGFDGIAVVACTDEYKVLALDRLPVTNPPRDTYADVVLFDKPSGYWRMDEPSADAGAAATVGKSLSLVGTATLGTPAAIVGDPGTHMELAAGGALFTTVDVGESGDPTGLGEYTVELWFRFPSNPGANRDIIVGPQANSLSTYIIKLLTTGAVQAEARNSAGTNSTTASGVLATNTWHHIVAAITGPSTFTLYVNGAAVSSTSFTGSFHGTLGASDNFTINSTAAAEPYDFDEVAVYRYGLSSARVSAHYTAGASRGFPEQEAGERINATLEAVGSQAPRLLDEGGGVINDQRIVPRFQTGQPPLTIIQEAVKGESKDAVFFVSRDGTLVFLDAAHRAGSPYNTVQATFDDDGTDLPYTDVDVDYSDSFLYNEWNVTTAAGGLATASDGTSIDAYYKRPNSLDVPVNTEAVAGLIADAMLAKYKDPMLRVLSLTVNTADPDTAETVLGLDLGDRIVVRRNPPGGGAVIAEELFIQSIGWSASAASPIWTAVLGVSPL